MEQLRQQQLQQQQQQLLQQQQQRQLNAQQQVQFALSRQGSGQQQGQQPRPAAVFASAAQHAQYQQQQRMQPSSSGAYISHPLSECLCFASDSLRRCAWAQNAVAHMYAASELLLSRHLSDVAHCLFFKVSWPTSVCHRL